jgi:HTH-type transcriptional regulator / antitoxin HigA
MSKTYRELLEEIEPAIIQTDEEYDLLNREFSALFDKGRRGRTPQEEKLFRLVALLIEDYDRRHGIPALNETPAERLQYLLEVSGKSSSDLIPIFGQRSHVSEALNGKREISADQARKLGKMFRLNPGYFL